MNTPSDLNFESLDFSLQCNPPETLTELLQGLMYALDSALIYLKREYNKNICKNHQLLFEAN